MPKITKAQQKIVDLMKDGYMLVTTKGLHYEVHLVKKGALSIKLTRRTCESMAAKELITPGVDLIYGFSWVLAP